MANYDTKFKKNQRVGIFKKTQTFNETMSDKIASSLSLW